MRRRWSAFHCRLFLLRDAVWRFFRVVRRHPVAALASVTTAACLIAVPVYLSVNTRQYYQVIEVVLSTNSRHQTAAPEVAVDFQKTPIHDQYPLQEQICAYFQQKTPEITWRPVYQTPANLNSLTYIRLEKITPFQFDVLVSERRSGAYLYRVWYDPLSRRWRAEGG